MAPHKPRVHPKPAHACTCARALRGGGLGRLLLRQALLPLHKAREALHLVRHIHAVGVVLGCFLVRVKSLCGGASEMVGGKQCQRSAFSDAHACVRAFERAWGMRGLRTATDLLRLLHVLERAALSEVALLPVRLEFDARLRILKRLGHLGQLEERRASVAAKMMMIIINKRHRGVGGRGQDHKAPTGCARSSHAGVLFQEARRARARAKRARREPSEEPTCRARSSPCPA